MCVCGTGGQPDHDHAEEPGAQGSEGGAGAPLRAVGRTLGGGDAHEEAGRVHEEVRGQTGGQRSSQVCVCGQCEMMLEEFEEVVEDWYFHHQDQRLERFLCQSHVLEASERGQA